MSGLRAAFSHRSDVGRVRTRNEDSVRVDSATGLIVVADGMGGHPGGDVASARAADTVVEHLNAGRTEERSGSLPSPEALADTVRAAHEAVRAEGRRQPRLEGMGTTLTVLALDRAGWGWAVGHAGDSRAYLLRQGELTRITRDDTWVQDRVEAGEIPADEAWQHPAGHILSQGLGLAEAPRARTYSGALRSGDRFLLCSDGLTDMVPESEIARILGAPESASDLADRLVEEALQGGGKDNVTVALALLESA